MGFRGRSGEVGLPGVTSCEKSISRNHVSFVLHSRFPPFGFVLKPVGSIYMVLGELRRNRARASQELIPLLELIRRRLTPQLIHDVTELTLNSDGVP